MSKDVVISVAMTTYNGEDYLKEQLDSILSQSYNAFEIIICDDGSTDSTLEILDQYRKEYPNIYVYTNQCNLGYVKNFERVIGLCNSEYIALSDQDDIWLKDKLQLQIEAMFETEEATKETPVLIHSDLNMIDENGLLIQRSYSDFRGYKLKVTKDLGHILGPNGVMGNTIMINKALKEKILPFSRYVDVHDYWIAVISELCGVRINLSTPLVQYRIHQTNASNDKRSLYSSKKSLQTTRKMLTRQYTLPYQNSDRKRLLEEISKRCTLNAEELSMLKAFSEYLEGINPKVMMIKNLLRYSYVKRGFWYRVKLISKILIMKRVEEV